MEMKEKIILVLEKRGCNFWEDDEIKNISDLENYRHIAYGWTPKNSKGSYILEISKTFRINKKSKKSIYIHGNAVYVRADYYKDGVVWGDIDLLNDMYDYVYDRNLKYTKNDLIKLLNKFGEYRIKDILITENIYTHLESIAGHSVKKILENCILTTEVMNTKEHHVIKFYDNNFETFEYDLKTNRIVG